MNDSIIKLSEYIEETKKDNTKTKSSDIRLSFFRLKKLNEIMLLKKSVSCGSFDFKTSSSLVRPLIINKPLTHIDLRLLSPKEIEYIINDNIDSILINRYSPSEIGTLETRISGMYNEEKILFLDCITVDPKYRNYGLAAELINDLKNSAVNNNFHTIRGEIMPLDHKGFIYYGHHTPLIYQLINYLSYKTDRLKEKSFIDFKALCKIYKKLGFDIDKENHSISMNVDNTSITPDKKLPNEFTHFDKNNETLIIYK